MDEGTLSSWAFPQSNLRRDASSSITAWGVPIGDKRLPETRIPSRDDGEMAAVWGRSNTKRAVVLTLLSALAIPPISLIIGGTLTRSLVLMLVTFLAVIAALVITRISLADIWNSECLWFKTSSSEAISLLGTALEREGLVPKSRTRRIHTQWITLDVAMGLNITIIPGTTGIIACIGPVRADNRWDVDGVERLIEAALTSPT